VTSFTVRTSTQVERPYVALLVIPSFGLLLWSHATSDVLGRRSWLRSRPLLRLGEWSFALYLVHKPTFLLTNQWHWWDNSGGFEALALFTAYLCLAVVVAAALYLLVERPVERRLRRLRIGDRNSY
jgi:peptidoglycan/LPS O-acetylase OafA/YrhL